MRKTNDELSYDQKVRKAFDAVCKKNGDGASAVEVTEEMERRKWLSPLDTVIDIADIMRRLFGPNR